MGKRKASGLNGVSDLYLMRQIAEKNQAPDDQAFREQYPRLFSILGDVRISEDQVIDPPGLSLRNSAGDWCLSVSVPGLRMYGEVLAATFLEAMALAETRLADGSFPWKVNTKKPIQARKVKAEKN